MIIIGKNKFISISDSNKKNAIVTDVNGKSFEVEISSLNDASTIIDDNVFVKDNDGDINDISISLSITDSEGKTMDSQKAISAIENGKVSHVEALFEATHTGLNNNYGMYTSESMAEDAQTFVVPYSKPLLKNHDDYSEPLGRVKNAQFDQSEICQDKDTINVTYDVRDKDAMLKLADGRYKTVSIGASAKNIKCNVCGKQILKDGAFKFCGHWRGEKYGEQKCSWTYEGLTYGETSIVNKPADQLAQLKGLKVFMKDADNPNPKDSANDDPDIFGIIDESLHDDPNDDPKDENTDDNVNYDIENLKNQLSEIQNNNESLKSENESLKSEIINITVDKTNLENLVNDYKSKNSLNDSEFKNLQNKINKLSNLNRTLLEDFVKFKVPSINDEDIKNKTSKELNDAIYSPTRRVLDNPGLSINDNYSTDDNSDAKKEKENFYDYINQCI